MAVWPLMLSALDRDLLGVANRTDAMGILAVWTARARDIVPHLTEQTTDIRGFQILLEGIRLWEMFERTHPDHVGEAANFFVLMEQAVARLIGRRALLKSIEPDVREAVAESGMSVRFHATHFPGNGQQGNFEMDIRRLLPVLKEAMSG